MKPKNNIKAAKEPQVPGAKGKRPTPKKVAERWENFFRFGKVLMKQNDCSFFYSV